MFSEKSFIVDHESYKITSCCICFPLQLKIRKVNSKVGDNCITNKFHGQKVCSLKVPYEVVLYISPSHQSTLLNITLKITRGKNDHIDVS